MSVIIRLQNLPWSANALDIRQFFNGLGIPEGGVHIVGGELGDAFIAFSTDEDARQAFNLNGGKIKEVQIKLMLSSRAEMQKVIEAARNPLAAFMQQNAPVQAMASILPAAIPQLVDAKKDDVKEKRERRRSRSRSRDRKDRSRERDRRDRRRRDRSRSRSRDRRDRRRRDRSSSRERRSKDRDRRSKDRRRSEEKGFSSNSNSGHSDKEQKTGIWEDPVQNNANVSLLQQQPLMNAFISTNLEEARKNLNALGPTPQLLNNRNGFQNQNDGFVVNRNRENWNAMGGMCQGDGRQNFGPRGDRIPPNGGEGKFHLSNTRHVNQGFGEKQSMPGYGRQMGIRSGGRSSRFDKGPDRMMSDRTSLLDLPHPENNKNCCVQFATTEGKLEALQRSGGLLKQNVVEVVHLEDNVFDVTVDRYRPDFNMDHAERRSPERAPFRNRHSPNFFKNNPPSQFCCIAIEDLPIFTKEQDMLKIFSDYSMLSIWLVNRQRHIIAYIKFANPDDAKKAVAEKGKHAFDGKPLDIRPCSDDEYASVNQDDIEVLDDDGDENKIIEEDKLFLISECVSLSGLPLKTNDRDISDFFSDVAIVPNKIHLVTSNVGFTGQAYCEFSSPTDAEIALEKNGLPLGSGTIVVESVTRCEMEAALGGNSRKMNQHPNQMRSLFSRNYGHGFAPRGGGAGMGPRPPMRRFAPTPINPADLANNGCTLLMENVPYKAGLNEILEFFNGFEIPPDNVLRRYNENGTPSGEAKVIFTNTTDAFQALQDRNLGKIRDRTIYLSHC
ncbi:hypothetical protein FQA39_LY17584 [Lamprigera yunnana]|nr:hypothetical protein FQA39_LY17584 [Lamprigera yunnana]